MSHHGEAAEAFIGSFERALSREISEVRRERAHHLIATVSELHEETTSCECIVRSAPTSLGVSLPTEAVVTSDEMTSPCTVVDFRQGRMTLSLPGFLHDALERGKELRIEIDPAAPLVKLQLALVETMTKDFYNHSLATALFKNQPHSLAVSPAHPLELNACQQHAIDSACSQSISFIWGPPGTGKSKTLAALAGILIEQGERICIATTTNAAVDALLTHCLQIPGLQACAENDCLLRMGSDTSEFAQFSLSSIQARCSDESTLRVRKIRQLRRSWKSQLKAIDSLEREYLKRGPAQQVSLFSNDIQNDIPLSMLQKAFPRIAHKDDALAQRFYDHRIQQRKLRLQSLLTLSRQLLQETIELLAKQQSTVIERAQLIVTTLSSLTYYDELRSIPVDTMVIDEAGMVIPPSAYLATTLAEKRVVIAGDPCQLPPVVHSRDSYVQGVMARDLFHIAPGAMHGAQNCTRLSVQYRMPPLLGDLVSTLFYDGTLQAAKENTANALLSYIDLEGHAEAEQTPERSRRNVRSHDLVLSLIQTLDDTASGAIITPYKAQARLYTASIRQLGISEQWQCATVHRFQGKERSIVILDLVDAEPLRPGILLRDTSSDSTAARLLNVSISRASERLYIVADFSYFERYAPQSITSRLLSLSREQGTPLLSKDLLGS